LVLEWDLELVSVSEMVLVPELGEWWVEELAQVLDRQLEAALVLELGPRWVMALREGPLRNLYLAFR